MSATESAIAQDDHGLEGLALPPLPESWMERLLAAPISGCEYEPLIDARTLETRGYEALARFELDGKPLPNEPLFAALHHDRAGFFVLEGRLKRFQLQHRPQGWPLHVNLDPDVFEDHAQLDHWLALLKGAPSVTVEIIENSNVTHLRRIAVLAQALREAGIQVGLDDVGGARSLLAVDQLELAQVFKLDRSWLGRIRRGPYFQPLLDGILAFARSRSITTVLEGVETEEDLAFARKIGVDQVQGFLFRPRFLKVRI